MKGKHFFFSMIILGSFFLFPVHVSGIESIPNDNNKEWETYNGFQAGRALLKLRQEGNASEFADKFLLFLNQGRTKREILDLLRVTGLPLKNDETEAIGDIISFGGGNCIDIMTHGYSIECHATPGTRISLVFLNEIETKVYAKKFGNNKEPMTSFEEKVYANLEGRLCVWAKKRKIHLGGPHFTYERVLRILSSPSELD